MPSPAGADRPATPTRWPAGAVPVALAVGVMAVSSSAILIRVADADPLALAWWRSALGALALAPLAWRQRRVPLAPRHGRALIGAGLLLGLHFAVWQASLDYTTVASSTVLVTMSPLFVGAGAAWLLREPPSARTWTGMAVAMAGAAGVALADAGGGHAPAPLAGDALAFAGAVAIAGYLLIGRTVRQRLPVARYAATVYAVAAVVLLAACLLAGIPLAGYDALTWAAIAALVVGPQLLGHTVFNAALSQVTATAVALVVLAEPVGATLLAAVLLGELPAAGFWLAAPLVLAGVWLSLARSRRAGRAGRVGPTTG